MRNLNQYYLETDSFRRTLRGEVRIVVGRKGSGKTAIFLQVRDAHRGNTEKVVLDLKPDGYKLLKFKDLVLKMLEEGTSYHTIMVFWEYVLLLEICHKILINDRDLHLRNQYLFEPYRELAVLYESDEYFTEGDFSERIAKLMDRITQDYLAKYGENNKRSLSTPEITGLIYKHDIKQLNEKLSKYLTNKNSLWVLIDNLDKGWPTHGIEAIDLIIIRALLESTRKMQREMGRQKLDVNSIIFLRNDVFELLLGETADRGKESKIVLDWTDPDMLRELLRRRIVFNSLNHDSTFSEVWSQICCSHVDGEESSQYMIDRSLMRPRFLIDLLNYCKSFAVNLKHENIDESDVIKGFSVFSNDILQDISLEIRDVCHEAEDIVYEFLGQKPKISDSTLHETLRTKTKNSEDMEKVISTLVWYGFLGVVNNGDVQYIYSLNYNTKLLEALINKKRVADELFYYINPAFWPGLLIDAQ